MDRTDEFDPAKEVEDSQLILDAGAWPNFHDAEVHELNMWRGDVRPEENVWIGPVIEASFELCALKEPFIAVLRFHECDGIEMVRFNHQNAIYDLAFSFEQRGHYRDGRPLPAWICVSFTQAFGVRLSFKCVRVEVLERRDIPQCTRE